LSFSITGPEEEETVLRSPRQLKKKAWGGEETKGRGWRKRRVLEESGALLVEGLEKCIEGMSRGGEIRKAGIQKRERMGTRTRCFPKRPGVTHGIKEILVPLHLERSKKERSVKKKGGVQENVP